jgi:hypothetical protein
MLYVTFIEFVSFLKTLFSFTSLAPLSSPTTCLSFSVFTVLKFRLTFTAHTFMGLLGFWIFSVLWYSKEPNWICFCPQLRGVGDTSVYYLSQQTTYVSWSLKLLLALVSTVYLGFGFCQDS